MLTNDQRRNDHRLAAEALGRLLPPPSPPLALPAIIGTIAIAMALLAVFG